MLKASLCRAYGFTTERVAAYGTGGDARKHEERVVLTRNTAEQLPVDKLDLSAADDRGAAVMQYKVSGGGGVGVCCDNTQFPQHTQSPQHTTL